MRTALAWLLLCSAAMAQRVEPGVPPGWTVYVVHASWCAPCQRFKSDYFGNAEFRNVLESGFAVKNCDWERGNDQRFARRHGISSLPGFIVFRNGIHQQSFTGYDGNWRAFCEKLNLDVMEPRQPPGGGTEGPARPITPVERSLPEIADLRAELDRLRRQVTETAKPPKTSETTSGALPAEKPARPDIPGGTGPSPLPPVLSIPAVEAPAGGGSLAGSGVGAEWAKVGAAVLALAAPQFAIPAGVLSAAATAYQMLRRRRQTMQAQQQQPHRQTVIERPVIVPTDTPPPPARVEQTTHYVPIERETHREAWQWAADQYARKYPGSEGLIQALNHLIGQYESSKREAA